MNRRLRRIIAVIAALGAMALLPINSGAGQLQSGGCGDCSVIHGGYGDW